VRILQVVPALVIDGADRFDVAKYEQALNHAFEGGIAEHAIVIDLEGRPQKIGEVARPGLGIDIPDIVGGRTAEDKNVFRVR